MYNVVIWSFLVWRHKRRLRRHRNRRIDSGPLDKWRRIVVRDSCLGGERNEAEEDIKNDDSLHGYQHASLGSTCPLSGQPPNSSLATVNHPINIFVSCLDTPARQLFWLRHRLPAKILLLHTRRTHHHHHHTIMCVCVCTYTHACIIPAYALEMRLLLLPHHPSMLCSMCPAIQKKTP